MEELLPVVSDDLDWQESGHKTRTPADHTRYLGWEGTWYRIDMTTAHTTEIEEFLARYTTAGQIVEAPPKGRQRPRNGWQGAAYERNQRILEFAKARGLKYTVRRSGQGAPYFPVATLKAFEAWEAAGGSSAGRDQPEQR
jgi:Lsr2